MSRTPTFEGPSQLRGRVSPPAPCRVVSDSSASLSSNGRYQPRPLHSGNRNYDGQYDNFYPDDGTSSSYGKHSPDRYVSGSPLGSNGHLNARPVSMSLGTSPYHNGNYNGGVSSLHTSYAQAQAPPTPIRAKKPPPPPPPPKRNALRSVDM